MMKYLMKTFALDEKGAKNLVQASIATFFSTVTILLTNIVLILFLDDILLPILKNETIEVDLNKYIVSMVVTVFLLIIGMALKYQYANVPAHELTTNKRINLAKRLRLLPLSYFEKRDITDLTTTIMKDVESLEEIFSAHFPSIFSGVFSTLLLCIGITAYDYRLGIAVFWCIPISFGLFYTTKKMQKRDGAKPKKIVQKYLDKLQETVENISDIKSNNREDFHKNEMYGNIEKLEKTVFPLEVKFGSLITFMQMILKIGMASTVIVSAYLLMQHNISEVEFIIFLLVALRIYEPLQVAMANLTGIFQAFYSIERLQTLENVKVQEGTTQVDFTNYDIEFDNVCFSYDEHEVQNKKQVLDHVSFTAKQGEITALVGPSGGGKTTIMRLATRFWDIQEGKITIGGNDISKIDPETLLTNISIVFQDVKLFNNTVMENIRVGRKGATDEEVIEAAKNARCHDFITQMQNGYDTMIGENGSKISGGERQRISIARALLKDAPIVFLDEATSSLDVRNESAVQEAILYLVKNKTVVVIAHRMRTIMGADKIMVLKNAKIIQQGTHKELVSVEGEYASMVALQVEASKWKLKSK